MSSQAWGRIPQTEEEELEASMLLPEDHADQPDIQGQHQFARNSAVRLTVGMAVMVCAVGLILWSSGSGAEIVAARPVVLLEKQVNPDSNVNILSDSNQAWEKLTIEEDLQVVLLRLSKDKVQSFVDSSPQDCHKEAGRLFSEFMKQSGLEKELDVHELKAFKLRFVSAMGKKCNVDDIRRDVMQWLRAAGRELEEQKPLVTTALVDSLNNAELGFQAKMYPWLLDESRATLHRYLGLKPTPEGQRSVFNRGRGSGRNVSLPEEFKAEEKWPQCTKSIRRIHNQGHCGSCWAFSGAASIDARLCIATNGSFEGERDVVSRLQATSCAAEMFEGEYADGCQGGFAHWPMEMMAQRGIVSTSCIPYYISGEGSEHFTESGAAPPCGLETHCQGGYNMTMQEDTFWAPGIENYDVIHRVHGDEVKIMAMKIAIYEEGPVSFSFYVNNAFFSYAGGVFGICNPWERANHAVYASGWGIFNDTTPYIQASNSWSTRWGVEGRFLIHPNCVVGVTIPGSIQNPQIHPVGDVDLSVPKDPDNSEWPWKAIAKCPFKDGCITDLEGDGNYTNGEYCESDELNGATIEVVTFNTEAWYDFLYVGERRFSGDMESVLRQGLDGLNVTDSGIKFKSDASVVKSGFKICAK